MRKHELFTPLVLLLIMGLFACQSVRPTESNLTSTYPTQLTQGVNQYPESVDPYPSGYPTFEPYPFKTSIPNTITIHGFLVIYHPEIARPIEDGIFLVPISKENIYDLSVPLFSLDSTPQAEFDERTGEFYFTNIEPGLYVLAVQSTGLAQLPVLQQENDTKIVIELTDKDRNSVIELGFVRLP